MVPPSDLAARPVGRLPEILSPDDRPKGTALLVSSWSPLKTNHIRLVVGKKKKGYLQIHCLKIACSLQAQVTPIKPSFTHSPEQRTMLGRYREAGKGCLAEHSLIKVDSRQFVPTGVFST